VLLRVNDVFLQQVLVDALIFSFQSQLLVKQVFFDLFSYFFVSGSHGVRSHVRVNNECGKHVVFLFVGLILNN